MSDDSPTTALVPLSRAGALEQLPPAARLYAAFLSGRSQDTLRAYRADLADFAAFASGAGPEDAAALLLARGHGGANELALRYRADLLERDFAPATVNRRLAALRSLVKLARTLGQVPWVLEVDGVKAEAYRDTRGPGRRGFLRLLEQLQGRPGAKAVRDRAILRLLFDLGLRRAEVCRLDADDYSRDGAGLAVLGKGRSQRERLTLPRPTRAALDAWLAARGAAAGPLFHRLDTGGRGTGRLTGAAVYQIVRGLGEGAGLKARPHGLRHAAITEALDLTNGDVRAVQRFSRHRNLNTLQLYDDSRKDLGGDVARRVAEASDGEGEAA